MIPTGRTTFFALWILALAACGSGQSTADVPLEDLPPYTAEQAALYNDAIAPEVFGLNTTPGREKPEEFVQLVQQADHIGRVKLVTITRTKTPADGRIRYHLALQPLGDPLRGETLQPQVELTVGMGSPSISLLRALDSEAIGSKFIILLKRYRAKGQMVLHFRAYPDSAKVADAIKVVE